MKQSQKHFLLPLLATAILAMIAVGIWQFFTLYQRNQHLSQQLTALQLDAVIEQAALHEKAPDPEQVVLLSELSGIDLRSKTKDFRKIVNADGSSTWWLVKAYQSDGSFLDHRYLEKLTLDKTGAITASRSGFSQIKSISEFTIMPHPTLSIESVLPPGDQILLRATGGDGCGSGGTFWISDGRSFRKIVDFDGGCNANVIGALTGGKLIGSDIYLGEVSATSSGIFATGSRALWKYNSQDGSRRLVATETQLPPGILSQFSSANSEHELLFEHYQDDDQVEEPRYYGFDLDTLTFEETKLQE